MNIPHPRLYQSHENVNLNRLAEASLKAVLSVKSNPKSNIIPTFVNLCSVSDYNTIVLNQHEKDRLGISFNDNDMFGYQKESSIARYFSHENGVIVETTSCFNELMDNTDIQSVPVKAIKLPFDFMYFHITKKPVINGITSPIAGIYISRINDVVTKENYKLYEDSMPLFEIGESVSILSLMYVFDGYGSPFEKRSRLSTNLFLRDEDTADFVDLISEHIVNHANPINKSYLKELSTLSIELLLKTILYMNTKGMRSVEVNELSEFKKKYQAFGKKRAEKQANKFPSKYDRIIVGPESIQDSSGRSNGHESKSTHWRRGHFRNQPHGEGLKERHIIWIQPTIINAVPDETPVPKTYKMTP